MTGKESSPDLSLEAEIAEGFEIRQALKRQALKRMDLERAAQRPSIFSWGWSCATIGGILLYFNDQLVDYIWLIALVLLIEIKSNSAAVHSRIDAILELERLSWDNEPLLREQSARTDSAVP